MSIKELCRNGEFSQSTFNKWRSKFGGMDTSMISRMKELGEMNRHLRKMYIEEKSRPKSLPSTSQKSKSVISLPRDGQRSGGPA
jgi:putative transposase